MRRREFLTSGLAAGATAATPAAAAPSKQYSVTVLPRGSAAPGGQITLDPPIDTTVQFVHTANIEQKYQDILINFKNDNPTVDLTDPDSFLIVAKPKHEAGEVKVACICQCGTSTQTSNCGGSGGGGSKTTTKVPRAK